MFRSRRGFGDVALTLVESGLQRGRETMSELMARGQDALEVGQRALGGLGRRRTVYRPNGYVWLGVGAAAVMVAVLLRRRQTLSGWSGRTVADVMIRDVQTIPGGASIVEAAQRMRDANVGSLPVVEGDVLRGMVTDRDLVVRGVARGLDLRTARVMDVATHNPTAAHPDWSVDRAMETMAGQQIGRLPVVDDGNRLVGIVTLSSLALRSGEEDEAIDAAKQVSLRSARAV
jgi:CBS domain-containing protein